MDWEWAQLQGADVDWPLGSRFQTLMKSSGLLRFASMELLICPSPGSKTTIQSSNPMCNDCYSSIEDSAIGATIDNFDERGIECNFIGAMNIRCTTCNAIFFKDEQTKTTKEGVPVFSLCCSNDDIYATSIPVPEITTEMLLLIGSADYRNRSMHYNNAFTFVTTCK
jgi:hypothetical protein